MTSLKNCIPKNPFSQNTVRVTQGSCPAGADRDDSYYSTVLSLLVYDNEVRIVVAVGKVDLLRSLAKVKVKMADGMKARGYALGSITFNNYNTEGFTLPVTYNTSKNTKEILFSTNKSPNFFVRFFTWTLGISCAIAILLSYRLGSMLSVISLRRRRNSGST